ncbi:MAG: response regulator [Burkholderiaceae bacterium]|nr:response regulator [Burkholderiaceae bacterium]MBP7659662.1 response regulator [Burkholderiaceae bacterium]
MFQLTRYFSIASLAAIVAAAGLLGQVYQRAALDDLTELGEQNNIALSAVLANSLWHDFVPLLRASRELDTAALRDSGHTRHLRDAIIAHTRGLSVVKVKAYDLEGRTVFSTEPAQIGEIKQGNRGFQQARAGSPASEITHRDSFSAFEQTIVDRDLVSSYIPVRRSATGPIEAVFEVYDDITPHLGHIAQTQRKVMLTVAGVLCALYAALFLIVKRADRVIRGQASQLEGHLAALQDARETLEARVRARTAELAATNHQLTEEMAERRRTEAALQQARDVAEAASRAKSQFVANMSHEIRTPMIGVLGMTELLLQSGLDAQQRELARTAYDSGLQMMDIINDILDFSKIEAGKLKLELIEFDPRALVEGVRDMVSQQAKAKGLDLRCSMAPELPRSLRGDPTRLRQILVNLAGNAVKFTAAGAVSIDASLVPQPALEPPDLPSDSRAVRLRLTVSDTGIGMSRETQSRLFQAFTQADESMTRRFGGSGLGLTICRQLVGQMQGEIGVDSEPGQGARFWFTVELQPGLEMASSSRPVAMPEAALALALAPSPALALAPAPAPANFDKGERMPDRAPAAAAATVRPSVSAGASDGPSPPALPPLHAHLLLAEDNPVNQAVARRILTGFGCTVEVVDDGAKALEAVQRSRFDGVLMDCQMPVMDGFTATVAIRAWEALEASRRPLLIVALTANAMADDRSACLAAGMDEHLSKPYRRDQIHAMLSRLLHKAEHA